jgi:hypothetical protein
MYITDEETAAVKAMRQAYDRLKELGWEDISRFKPEMKPFSAPFLGIEVGSHRPIECEYRGKTDEGLNIFTSLGSDDDHDPLPHERAVRLIMFRHYEVGTRS